MSHIVQIKTQVRDPVAIDLACRRLELPRPVQGTATLYGGEVTGTIVELPQWRYPIVFNCQTGDVKYDNFEGRWGDQSRLDEFLQTYAVEKVKRESRLKGYSVTERSLDDGSVKLTVNVEGGAA